MVVAINVADLLCLSLASLCVTVCLLQGLIMLEKMKLEWFSNIRGDLLAGLVVALALIPEAIAFSIIAGVDPKVGLYASFCIAVFISLVGGVPGLISPALGCQPIIELITAIQNEAYKPTFGSTPAIIENAIASGIKARGYCVLDYCWG